MKIAAQVLFFLSLFEVSSACEFKWEQLPVKTPLYDKVVRPQGLSYFRNSLVLSTHSKDSKILIKKPSALYFYKLPEMKLEKVLQFPEDFHHISGLAASGDALYAVDFDRSGVFQLDIPQSLKSGIKVWPRKVLEIEKRGLSGLSIQDDMVAVSYYLHPFRSPYLRNRHIELYSLSTGKKVSLSGEIKTSNYSQGLAFFKKKGTLYLAEAINDFENTLKYKITGLDNKPDILRVYSIHLDKSEIHLVSETSIPTTMAEDLSFDGEYLYLTDEQDFHFYKASIAKCL